jgi:beta-xylosidase
VSFTPPEIFFDPGYEVIDATMLHARGQYWLIFKDERPEPLHKEIKIARGPSVEGPWTNIQGPFTEAWSEGPSALEIDGKYVIYYDHYHVSPVRYEAIGSSDLEHWEPINDRVTFPKGCKHGSFLKLTPEEAERLKRK